LGQERGRAIATAPTRESVFRDIGWKMGKKDKENERGNKAVIWRWASNVYQSILLIVVLGAVCWFVIHNVKSTSSVPDNYKGIRLLPVNYQTLGLFLSLFLPCLAIVYVIARLRVRRKEIICAFKPNELWRVYYDCKGGGGAEFRFEKYLWSRLSVYYNIFELGVFSLFAGGLTFIFFFMLSREFGGSLLLNRWVFSEKNWLIIIGTAFLGSFCGGIVVALRRYRTFDLRPTVFLQITAALIVGTFAGSVFVSYYPKEQMGILAFTVGYLTAINIRFLSRLFNNLFARLTNFPTTDRIDHDLEKVILNTEAIESLNRICIFSVKELASADPVQLYFNMPQQIEVINSMIDQALLYYYFEKNIEALYRVNIKGFCQLVSRLGFIFESEGRVTGGEEVLFLEDGERQSLEISTAAKAVLKSALHHRFLGIMLFEYREAFFRSPDTIVFPHTA
jgi:hypothetical protein